MFIVAIMFVACFEIFAQEITLQGIAVSNFKVTDSKRQIIILYKNNVPSHVCITDIPFTVFEKVVCLPTDEFRAEVVTADFHFPNEAKGTLQFALRKIRWSKTVKASSRNKHGFITLQPLHKRDMDKVYEK